MPNSFFEIKNGAEKVLEELVNIAKLRAGDVLVIGCSSSEIIGEKIGQGSSPEAAKALLEGIIPVAEKHGISIAAQCCEHLNRALIVERDVAVKHGYEIVSVRPVPKAGGSFATAIYEYMKDPVAVEHIQASAGLDIGGTLIGMHLKHVAVPVRLSLKKIGEAAITAATTRPKLIGGIRAEYPAGT